jgi:hypothetical protein
MSTDTAKTIASGVGPLIGALIAAYQLWLKPLIEEKRDVPEDKDRLLKVCKTVGRIRLHAGLFALLTALVTAIPVVGTLDIVSEIEVGRSISLERVIVVFVAIVGVVNVDFLIRKWMAISEEYRKVRAKVASLQESSG